MLRELKKKVVRNFPAPIVEKLKASIRVVAPRLLDQEMEQKNLINKQKKIRLRTEEELAMRARGLKEVRDIFDHLNIPYYLSGGTALGIIREHDFIPWDWDVEIATKTEVLRPRADELLSALKRAGFTITEHDPSKVNFKINAVKYGSRYEILGYFKMGHMRYRAASSYCPERFFSDGSTAQLRGETYSIVNYPEEYLEWFYGDWRTPLRTADKKAYLTASSRTGYLSRFAIKIISLFR